MSAQSYPWNPSTAATAEAPILMDTPERREQIKGLLPVIEAAMQNPNSRRAYLQAIKTFLKTNLPLSRVGVLTHLARMHKNKKSTSSIRLAIAALRKLIKEAEYANIITRRESMNARRVPNPKIQGVRLGKWLTQDGARQLVALPDRTTMKGRRDAALLALLVGCGLRREEASNLTWDKYREINGRMCLVDIVGKGGKTRTIPVPAWARVDLDKWKAALDMLPESVMPLELRCNAVQRLRWGGKDARWHPGAGRLSPNGVWFLVQRMGNRIGVHLRPHDLRRTLAQLMRKNGATLEQIQFTLGHDKIETTMRYLGGEIELRMGEAATDRVDLGALDVALLDDHGAGFGGDLGK